MKRIQNQLIADKSNQYLSLKKISNQGTPVPSVKSFARSDNGRKDVEALAEASKQFEAIFLEMMLKSMRSTVQKSEFMGGGHGEDLYEEMLDSEYAKLLSEGKNFGISNLIEEQLKPLVEVTEKIIKNSEGRESYHQEENNEIKNRK